MDFKGAIRFNAGKALPREILMNKLMFFAVLVLAQPALAQTKLVPKSVTARADNCSPIGRTADGKLVYAMKCDNIPVPPPSPQAELKETPAPAPAPEPEYQRTGIFGLSYKRTAE